MCRLFPRRLFAIVLLTVLVAPAAMAKSPEAADFFRNPEVGDAQISPDGNLVAMSLKSAAGRMQLVVLDPDKPQNAKIVGAFDKADVNDFHWINSHRLVFDVIDLQENAQTGNGALFAVDSDGTGARELVSPNLEFAQEGTGSHVVARTLPSNYLFFSALSNAGDAILVAHYVFNTSDPYNVVVEDVTLERLDTRTLEHHLLLDHQPPHIRQWHLDHNGEPRVAIASTEGRRLVYYRNKAGDWKVLDNKGNFDAGSLDVHYIDFDGGLFVSQEHFDTVERLDPDAPERPRRSFLDLHGFEFNGDWRTDEHEGKLLGLHLLTDAWGSHWLDSRMAQAQKAIDAALPATINTIRCGQCLSSRYLLVQAQSDRQPAQFYVYDPAQPNTLKRIAATRPWIDRRQMGHREFIRYAARDGLSIPAYLTLPPQRGKDERLPLVVLVHGGPWVRGATWEWDAQAQFLATRGYAVIQPEFRGSTGFGMAHARAGWRQWGLTMQDDLADAAQWAVDKGYADPNRIAIGGSSYGGYATLMGLIKDSRLYRCGFEYAGVSDLLRLYARFETDASDETRQFDMPTLVGDPEKDAAFLRANSPLARASLLRRPLLIGQGALDRRVPKEHGRQFYDAVSKANVPVEWVLYEQESHELRREADRLDFFGRVDAFLAKYLRADAVSPEAPGGRAAAQ